MDRRRFLLTSLASVAGPLASVHAQPGARVPKIGYLSRGTPTERSHQAFRVGLRELGYEDGTNVAVLYRFAEGNTERLTRFADELVRSNVDVLVASGAGAEAAYKATSSIPVVFVGVTDPVGFGWVKSLARPGGNMTGFSYAGVELNAKRLEIVKEALPQATRFAALAAPRHPLYSQMVEQLEATARSLRLRIEIVEVGEPIQAALDGAFERLQKARAHGVIVLQDQLFVRERVRIVDLAARYGIPAMYELREYVEAGGLMSYAADLTVQYRRAAIYADRILKGTKPADLPVEQPTKFELSINLKAAKALGLRIPPSVLLRADRVIE